MTEVPRAVEPSDAERLATLRATMGHGGAGGVSRALGQVLDRGLVRAIAGDLLGDDSLEASDSKVDEFTITDDATSVFELTFSPIQDSWNVSMGWPFAESRYSISGRTLTILDPADTFRSIAANGPRTLRVQYDHLTGVPTSPSEPATFPQFNGTGEQTTGTPDISLDTAPAAGSSVLLFYRSKFGGPVVSVVGLGATWARLNDEVNPFEVWLGTGCDGAGSLVTLASDHVLGLSIVEVTSPLTATAAAFNTAVGGTSIADLAAADHGVAIAAVAGGSGVARLPSGFSMIDNAFEWVIGVRATSSGEVIDASASTAWAAAVTGLVRYA